MNKMLGGLLGFGLGIVTGVILDRTIPGNKESEEKKENEKKEEVEIIDKDPAEVAVDEILSK